MDAAEEPPGPVGRRVLELLPAGSGSIGGALVGLALGGGPEGALAAAAVEPVVEQVVTEALARRRARAGRAIAAAAAGAGMTPEGLLDRILGDERLLDLAAAVVAAASETMIEAKIRALGRALANGALATDDAVIDHERFLVDTLADLEATHARVLYQLSIQHEGYGQTHTERGDPQAHGWLVDDLRTRLPHMTAVVSPVLNVLASRGLIRDTAVGTYDYRPRWALTDFGKQCLAMLEERGHEGSNDTQPTRRTPN